MASRFQVRTPENVTFEYELAGLGTRFFAWLADLMVLGAGTLACALCTPFFVALVLIFIWQWGYHVFTEYRWGGQSPGKRLLGIQVLSQDGLPIDLWQALVRNLVRTIDMMTPLYLLGGSVAFMSANRQRLGDMIAGTIVVRKRESVRPSEVMAPNERYNTLLEDAALVGRLRRGIRAEQRTLLVSLCLRRNELDLQARTELFRDAAKILRESFGLTVDSHLSDERLVLNVTAVLLARS